MAHFVLMRLWLLWKECDLCVFFRPPLSADEGMGEELIDRETIWGSARPAPTKHGICHFCSTWRAKFFMWSKIEVYFLLHRQFVQQLCQTNIMYGGGNPLAIIIEQRRSDWCTIAGWKRFSGIVKKDRRSLRCRDHQTATIQQKALANQWKGLTLGFESLKQTKNKRNGNGLFTHLQYCFYATNAVLCPWPKQYKLSGFCWDVARQQHCALCVHNSNKDKDKHNTGRQWFLLRHGKAGISCAV